VLYPKVNSLVINTSVFSSLSDAQRKVLRDAAIGTRDWAIQNTPSDAKAAAAFCKSGGRVVNAPDGEVNGAMTKAQAVYDMLRKDPATKKLIERITAIKAGLAEGPPVAVCEPSVSTPAPAAVSAANGPTAADAFPQGTFRKQVALKTLLDAGLNQATAYDHAGRWELAFDRGKFSISKDGEVADEGSYCVVNGRLTVGLHGDPPVCANFFTATWKVDGDHLQLSDVQAQTGDRGDDVLHRVLFGGDPFVKAS